MLDTLKKKLAENTAATRRLKFMAMLRNGYVSYHHFSNSTLDWIYDSEKTAYDKNLSTAPADWYYRTNAASYKFNNNGHRCENPEEINFNNYALFTGCSYTYGVGVALEKSYPYLASQKLNLDYYNVAIGGCGQDTAFFNLMNWLTTYDKWPQLIVFQWPHYLRVLSLIGSIDQNSAVMNGNWHPEKKITEFLIAGEEIRYLQTRQLMLMNTIDNLVKNKTKIIHVINKNPHEDHDLIPKFDNIVRWQYASNDTPARDFSHPGNETHETIANNIVSKYFELTS